MNGLFGEASPDDPAYLLAHLQRAIVKMGCDPGVPRCFTPGYPLAAPLGAPDLPEVHRNVDHRIDEHVRVGTDGRKKSDKVTVLENVLKYDFIGHSAFIGSSCPVFFLMSDISSG